MTTKVRIPPRQIPAPPCPSTWIWLFAGILIGIIISFLVYLRELPSVDKLNQLQQQLEQLNASQKTVASLPSAKKTEKNQFSFYDEFVAGNVAKPPPNEAFPTPASLPDVAVIPTTTPTLMVSQALKPDIDSSVAEINTSQEMLGTMTPPPQGSSMLQVSSFRDIKKANQLKARLTQSGFFIQIESVQVAGFLWHRVLVGPYNNQNDISQAIAQLEQQHLDVILRRY